MLFSIEHETNYKINRVTQSVTYSNVLSVPVPTVFSHAPVLKCHVSMSFEWNLHNKV